MSRAAAAMAARAARVLLVLAAALAGALLAAAPAARAAWVDYPSSVTCGVTVPVEQCDPGDATVNNACRDMCHYGGCRGGRCVTLGGVGPLGEGRGCHCRR
ncbi:hypothetical protein ACP70R_021005 [Stipagrostis hirtigluma subsp. patula]